MQMSIWTFPTLNHFITESGHPAYTELPLPGKFMWPLFVASEPTENNTDTSRNTNVEKIFEGGIFSSSLPRKNRPVKRLYMMTTKDLQLPC